MKRLAVLTILIVIAVLNLNIYAADNDVIKVSSGIYNEGSISINNRSLTLEGRFPAEILQKYGGSGMRNFVSTIDITYHKQAGHKLVVPAGHKISI